MANESAIFWIDVENNTLLTGWESATPSQRPSFKQGDNIKVELHFVKRVSTNTGIFFDEVPTAGSSFRLAVGNPDTPSTGGTWSVDFGGGRADFLYNASALAVQTALNALTSITSLGGVTVEKVNGNTTYRISFNNKVALPDGFSGDGTNLLPSSTVVVDEIKVGSATVRSVWQIKPTQVPIAYQSVWTAQSQSALTTTAVQSGTTRVKIYPAPKDGTFILSIGGMNTYPLSVFATALEMQDAITAVVAGFEVQKSGAYIWDVTQTTTPLVSVTVNGSGLISFDSIVGEVNFNNYETATLLAGATNKATTLEIEVTNGSSVATVLQTPVLIVANLINDTIFAPTPFEERVTESFVNSGLALKYNASNPSGYISDAPVDNTVWGRQNGQWQAIVPDGNNIPDYDNFVTYAVGSQVYFQGKFYRMVNTAGAAGYDPVGHPSYWESLSGTSPNLSGYAQLSGATFTGVVSAPEIRNPLGTDLVIDSYNNSGLGVHYEHKFTHLDGKFVLATNGGGLTFPDGTTQVTSALPLTGGTMTGSLTVDTGSGYPTTIYAQGIAFEGGATDYQVSIYDGTMMPSFHAVGATGNGTYLLPAGITFPDASVQTTAAVTPDLSGYALLDGATFTGKVVTTASVSTAPLKIGVSTTAPTTTVAGDIWVGTNNVFFKDSTNTQRALVNQNTQNTFSTNQIISASSTLALLRITQSGTGQAIVVEDATNPDTSAFIVNADGVVGIQKDPATWTPTAGVALDVTGKIATASATASAGLNLGATSVAPTTPVQGDIWMASNTDTLRYRGILTNTTFDVATRNASNTFLQPQIISNPSNATIPAFRITNIATATTAHSLLVEDETNPDTTAFIIDNAGNIGIGVPTGWTPTQKFELNGSIKFTADSSVQTTAYIPSAVAITGGSINGITIDGGTY